MQAAAGPSRLHFDEKLKASSGLSCAKIAAKKVSKELMKSGFAKTVIDMCSPSLSCSALIACVMSCTA